MKRVKRHINIFIWTLVGLYLSIAILVNIPAIQSYIGSEVSTALGRKLHTRVSVGRVDLGLFNRLIIDNVSMMDQQGKSLLKASRISAKFNYISLLKGKIVINSAQLFGLNANLYRKSAHAVPNYQFVIDALASKDTTNHTPLDLTLNSLIIRHGTIAYNQLDSPAKKTFDPHHIRITDLSSHIIINKLQDDSLNLHIKRLALKEQSGVDLRSLSLKLVANRSHTVLSQLNISLPHSEISLPTLSATYRFKDKKLVGGTLKFNGQIAESQLMPKDLSAFVPKLKKINRILVFDTEISGTDRTLDIHSFRLSVPQSGTRIAINSPADIRIVTSGTLSKIDNKLHWIANIGQMAANKDGLRLLAGNIPEAVGRMNDIRFEGKAGGFGNSITTQGILKSEAGNANINLAVEGKNFSGHIITNGFNLKQILNDNQFGILATDITVHGNIAQKHYQVKGAVRRFDFRQYAYRNFTVDGSYAQGLLSGNLKIQDNNIKAQIAGKLNPDPRATAVDITAQIQLLRPSALHLFAGKLSHAAYAGDIRASFKGNNINNAQGQLTVSHFSKSTSSGTFTVDSLDIRAGNNTQGHYLHLDSDFARAQVAGRFDYTTIVQSLLNAIASKLPSIQQLTPIRYRKTQTNNFTLDATVTDSRWLQEFLGLPVQLLSPLHISGGITNKSGNLEANVYTANVIYDKDQLKDFSVFITSSDNRLNADLSATKVKSGTRGTSFRVEASAADDKLQSVFSLDNHSKHNRFSGQLYSTITFGTTADGKAEAHIDIAPSTVRIGDNQFDIHPSSVTYSKNSLSFYNFAITNGKQHIKIEGTTTKDTDDALLVELNDINVDYILNLINFHSVKFDGQAFGHASISHLFGKPDAHANLQVRDFTFQSGQMGTLTANIQWNKALQQIDIDAQAVDTMTVHGYPSPKRLTDISGYVAPGRNYIDLAIKAQDTRAKFMESFCSSFMHDADVNASGEVRVWGDLKAINLTGEVVANGRLGITPLNTTYTLHNDTIRCLMDKIEFANDTISDRNGNKGIINGALYHEHLAHLTYDIRVKADHLLAYDTGPAYGNTFYGTIFGTGNVNIVGKSGEVNIDVNVTPEKGSQVTYDISLPDAVDAHKFIHWESRDTISAVGTVHPKDEEGDDDMPEEDGTTDIHINFLINTTPEATIKILMDRTTGDYISLNGSGVIRASYYNKAPLLIYGNYVVDHGLYKLTIQNIIKRDFTFTPGGTIVFGGDPYDATLNLKAQYTLNSVSLSDLQIGKSFSSNNIRVNCLMDITGTPQTPKVDFSLDMPTVSTDVKQMIYSLINSEEEMNQQVLYLLAVGRFYAQGSNNANAGNNADSQTSLAMQSILSGQISQQINTVLSSVIKDNNWNFGANISPGNEGWNNAEYEGILSGRLLNNRLIFNGQFGYRDNNNATTSFIGDFDLRYLIFPNGNLSIHVYNQTNDRYFTRNSLTTQGIGVILKKDFDSWRSLFGFKHKMKYDRWNTATGKTLPPDTNKK